MNKQIEIKKEIIDNEQLRDANEDMYAPQLCVDTIMPDCYENAKIEANPNPKSNADMKLEAPGIAEVFIKEEVDTMGDVEENPFECEDSNNDSMSSPIANLCEPQLHEGDVKQELCVNRICPSIRRKVLTLTEKSDIIKNLENGVSVTAVSKKYGIAKSTVCAIKKQKIKILNITTKSCGVMKRKTLKNGEMPKMEEKLFEWFCKQRLKNLPVSTEMLKAKAKMLHADFREKQDFTASDGWLQKFKRRFGIQLLKVSTEQLSTNPDPFKQELDLIIKRLYLTNTQIYNVDETTLFWRSLPEKTERETEKARITFLACCNTTGEHKIKPLVIGKLENPKCFKNFLLPVEYVYHKRAGMTSDIFAKWFHNSFIPQVKKFMHQRGLPEKAILLLNVTPSPSHPPLENLKSNDGNIFVMYTPPNAIPKEQSIIHLTKLFYRSNLLSQIASSDSEDLTRDLNNLNLKEAVLNLFLAWKKVKADTIQKYSRNILYGFNPEIEETYEEVASLLKEIQPQVTFTREEIENWNRDEVVESFLESDEDVEEMFGKHDEPLQEITSTEDI